MRNLENHLTGWHNKLANNLSISYIVKEISNRDALKFIIGRISLKRFSIFQWWLMNWAWKIEWNAESKFAFKLENFFPSENNKAVW